MKKLSVKEVGGCQCKHGSNGDRYSKGCPIHSETNEHLHEPTPKINTTRHNSKKTINTKGKQQLTPETNELPVESVSQPKAVDGYLKEFDELFVFTLKVMGEIRKRGGWNGNTATPETVKAFLKSSIERARQEERNKQILGYEKGQREERQRVVEMVEGMYPYEEIEKFKGMDYMEIVQEVKLDLKSKLGDAK